MCQGDGVPDTESACQSTLAPQTLLVATGIFARQQDLETITLTPTLILLDVGGPESARLYALSFAWESFFNVKRIKLSSFGISSWTTDQIISKFKV